MTLIHFAILLMLFDNDLEQFCETFDVFLKHELLRLQRHCIITKMFC